MPRTWPRLTTDRLVLRPFSLEDAKDVQRLAGDRDVAATTNVPHPYEDGVAEKWIGGHEAAFRQGSRMVLAVTLRSGELVGAIGLSLDEKHRRGELGYWIGKAFWNNGYCTEAVRAVVRYGFEEHGLKAGMLTLRDMGSYPSPPPCGAPRAPRRWPPGASFSRSCSREPAARSRNPARARTRRLSRPPKRR